MNKIFKKLTSGLLSFAMLLSMCVTTTFAEETTGVSVVKAILKDHSANPVETLFDSYDVNAVSAGENKVNVTITASNLVKHTNKDGNEGAWVGFALVAPENANKFQYALGQAEEALTTLSDAMNLEIDVTEDGESGVAVYFDIVKGTHKRYVKVQWLGESGNVGGAVTYVIDTTGVTLKSETPETPATYTVIFDANGHGVAPEAIKNVASGEKITAPEAPEAEGYTFGGWYKEAACENAWNFETDTVTKDITLYAKWTKNEPVTTTCTVTFKIVGGVWSDKTTADKTVTVTLTDGKGALTVEQIPTAMTGGVGYVAGEWKPYPTTDKDSITRDVTYTYTFVLHDCKAEGNKLELVAGKDATCTEAGTKAYYVCGCEKAYEDAEAKTEISDLDAWKKDADGGLIAAGHIFGSLIAEVAATCTEAGVKAHKDCTVCKKHFDADGKEIADLAIAALKHNFSDPESATYSKENADANKHYLLCLNKCGTRDEGAEHVSNPDAEEGAAQICTVCQYVIAPAADHEHDETPTETKAVAPTCVATGTKAYYTCESCGQNFEDEAYEKLIADLATWIVVEKTTTHTFVENTWNAEVPATCTDAGVKGYKDCDVCSKHFDEDGTTEITDLTIPAAHDWSNKDAVCKVCQTACPAEHTSGTCSTCGKSSGGSSSGGSGGGSTTVTGKPSTTTNPDGSSTTTTTQTVTKPDGSKTETTTETTTNKDGSSETVKTETTTKKDGSIAETVTETVKNVDGTTESIKTETVTDSKGNVTETVTAKDATGSTGEVVSENGVVTKAEATVSDKAVKDAAANGVAVTLPVEVPVAANAANAPAVAIKVPSGSSSVKVQVPATNVTAGTVAVIVHADGTEEIVKTSVSTESGVILNVDGNATVKIIDNSKNFKDTEDHWAANSIDFVSSRELFLGTTEETFSPASATSRAQLMTVLARLDGADTTGSALNKGMDWAVESGISDGANPSGEVTRQQLVVMLWRYAGKPETSHSVENFQDAGEISDYASTAINWAVENGIMNGNNGELNLYGSATRAHVAAMVQRLSTHLMNQ